MSAATLKRAQEAQGVFSALAAVYGIQCPVIPKPAVRRAVLRAAGEQRQTSDELESQIERLSARIAAVDVASNGGIA